MSKKTTGGEMKKKVNKGNKKELQINKNEAS